MRARTGRQLILVGVLVVLGSAYLLPIYLIVLTSLKREAQVLQVPPSLFTTNLTTKPYGMFLASSGIVRMLVNSVVVTVCSTSVAFVFGIPAAYALARYRGRGGQPAAFIFLASRFIPPISVVVAYFLGLTLLHLLNSLVGLGLVFLGMNLPYVVWMMRGFFAELPVEVEEAASVDGCSRLGTLWRVVLPVSSGGLAATAVLTLMFAWNSFLMPLLLTTTQSAETLPLAISAYISEGGVRWNEMAVAGTMIMAPAIVFSVFVQKYMARGLTFGAIKG